MNRVVRLSLAIIAPALLLVTFFLGSDDTNVHAQQGDAPTPTPATVSGPVFDIQSLPLEGKVSPSKYLNLDSNLNHVVEQARTGRLTTRAAAASVPIHHGQSVAVTLYIIEGYADTIASYLEANGASPRNIGADYIEAYIPVPLLVEASEQEGVLSVRTIVPPQPKQGTVVSGGVAAHGVTSWHAAGFRGRGVKIGVIDLSFKGFAGLMGSELPATVNARCYTGVGKFTANLSDCIYAGVPERTRKHGTAVTEAIFDIAPQADYYIADTSSYSDLLNTVRWMVLEGVDVINVSLGWMFDGPGDGTAYYSNAPLDSVDAAVRGGIIWVNSAGNSAKDSWYGAFEDSDSDGVHEFNASGNECNGVTIDLDPLEGFRAQLRWADSWGGASKDLDLYLIPVSGSTLSLSDAVATSEYDQSGDANDTPYETFSRSHGQIADGEYCLAVNQVSGAAPSWVQLLVWGASGDLQHYVSARSIWNPAESRNSGMLAAGAARVSNTNTIEGFSSRGPTTDNRTKPDIVGADGGTSSTYGTWYGTSQASPHVAGLAALVKQAYPSRSPSSIASYLKTNALGRDTVPNNTWGYGFAQLPTPPTSDATEPANNPAVGAPTISGTGQVGQTLTASTSTITDADEMTGATFAYQWVSGDGTYDSDISGATSASYTLVDDDEGKSIKVRVSFTDDAGHDESLTSAAFVVPSTVAERTADSTHVTTCSNGTVIPDTTETDLINDCAWLLQAKDDLAGTATLNWSGGTAFTSWTGVSVGVVEVVDYSEIPPIITNSNRVTRLILSGQRLTGTIPAELGNLPHVDFLYLAANQLTGTIPAELGNLSKLKRLFLDRNQLTGSIPTELGNLANLQLLNLSRNQLTGTIPSQLGSLSALKVLQLQENMLSGSIPAQLGSLSNLTSLYIQTNALTGTIPMELGSLSSLASLTLHENMLGGSIPPQLGSLSNLESLNLRDNQLTGSIPVELGSLSKLDALNLQRQKNADGEYGLTGTIPSQLGNLANLEHLYLNGNKLSGSIPSQLGNLSKMEWLYLKDNQLTGTIPSELGNLSALRDLELNDNMLSGSIPPQLGNLSNLTHLYLHRNRLTGSIPTRFGNLSNLEWLYLHENRLTGSIPAELGNLNNLTQLGLSVNNLSGAIPDELENLSSLTELYVGRNPLLTGCIPGGLRLVPTNDLADVDLPYCDVQLSSLSIDPGTLTPAFDADVTDYTAAVSQAQITLTATDDHGASIRFLDGNDAELVDAVGGLAGHQIDLPTGETVIQVKLTSADGRAEHRYAITVTRLNTQPAFPAGETGARSVPENTTGVEDVGAPVAAMDADGDPLAYAISGSEAASFDVHASSGQLLTKTGVTYDHETKASYSFTLSVHDGKDEVGGASTAIDDSITVRVTVTDLNELPVVSGPTSVTYRENDTREVARYLADDPENATLSWSVGPPQSNLSIATEDGDAVVRFNAPPDYEALRLAGSAMQVVVVTAFDGPNAVVLAVALTVENVEEPGTVSFSAQPQVATALRATLSDPDGQVSGLTWTWERSTNRSAWSPIGGAAAADYTPVLDDLGYYLRATATYEDGEGPNKTARSDPTDRVQAEPGTNNAPSFPSSETGRRQVAENTRAGVAIGPPVAADDPNNDALSYALSGADEASFDLDADSGQLRTEAVLDRETKASYSVTVTATDPSIASARIVVAITVTDVNERPAAANDTATTAEDTATVIGVLSNDEDPEEQPLTVVSLTRPANGTATVAASDQTITYTPSPNFHGVDSFTYRASDGEHRSAAATVQVTVDPVNDPPEVNGSNDLNVRENSTGSVAQYTATDPEGDAFQWSVNGADGRFFSIDSSGILTFQNPPNYEARADADGDNIYEVIIAATDSEGDPGELHAKVTVRDVDEAPEVSGQQSLSFSENQTTARVLATYSATDPEDPSATITRWSLTGPDAGDFTINENGQLTFRQVPDYDRPADSGRDNVYNFTVRASDGRHYGYLPVIVTVTDVNERPTITSTSSSATALRQNENVTSRLYTYRATDPEGGTVTWSVGGVDVEFFDIDESGQFSFKEENPPDFELPGDSGRDNVYDVTIQAHDDGGNTASLPVTVTVTNDAEGVEPTISTRRPPSAYRENGTSAVYTFRASEPQRGPITWSLQGDDRGDFTIIGDSSNRGVLAFSVPPDFEEPSDSDTQNDYELTVIATDEEGHSDRLSFTITVTDVNEGPEISRVDSAPGSVRENYDASQVLARYTATDPEEPSNAVTRWRTSGTDGGDFVMNEQGELRFRSSPDYERPADSNRDNTYIFAVQVSDGRYYGTFEETVTVTDVNERPTITSTSSSATALRQYENVTSRLYTYRATDPEGNTVTWSVGGVDAEFFDIDESGQFSFKEENPPDFELPGDSGRDNVYDVTIQAHDDGGNTASLPVTVTVRAVNEGPEVTSRFLHVHHQREPGSAQRSL